METSDNGDWLKKGMAELARVGAAMISILTVLWFFAEPAADRFVADKIDARGFAQKADVVELKNEVRNVQTDQRALNSDMSGMKSQLNQIEQLAREGREIQAQILFRLGGAKP